MSNKKVEFEIIHFNKLIPCKENPRNNKHAIRQVANSIKLNGFAAPIVANHNFEVLAGHTRLAAVKLLQKEEPKEDYSMVPVRFIDLTGEQARLYRIADNKLAEIATWDNDLLAEQLQELQISFSEELSDLFSDDELKELLDNKEEFQFEDTYEAPDEIKTNIKLGDIIEIGRHKLLCGDSQDINQIKHLLKEEIIDVVFTSPPYNANTKGSHGSIFNNKGGIKLYNEGYSDNLESLEYLKFAKNVLRNCFQITKGFIFWNVSYNANSRFQFIKQLEDHLEFLIELICWKKNSAIPFKGSLQRTWEPIFLFSTTKEKLQLKEITSNHWVINNRDTQTENHKACFPVELPKQALMLTEKTKVFDPFLGSGTTMVASHQLNKVCFGIEIDPRYCQSIIERMLMLDPKLEVKINGLSYDKKNDVS